MELGRTGIAIDIDPDGAHLEHARAIDELGYPAVWVPGGQVSGLDLLADLETATTSAAIVPGILAVNLYPAAEVAAFVAAHDRVVAGLGGPQQAKPLPALAAYLDELDAADPPLPADERLLAALGPRKLDLARERSAGAVPMLVTPEYTAEVRARLGPDALLALYLCVVLDDDPAAARATARETLGFLHQVAGYRANFLRMGFAESEVDELTDPIVDALVPWGDADAIAAAVAAHRAAGADHVVVGALHSDSQPGPVELAQALVGKL